MSNPKQVARDSAEQVYIESVLHAFSGNNPSNAILDQESRGQNSLVTSDQLPVDGSPRDRCSEEHEEAWMSTGIEFGPVVEGELFRNALLPAGWKLQATDHSMHSELLDGDGRVRATIFYKAAFYDRSARVSLQRRFYVKQVFGDASFEDAKDIVFEVTDADNQVFASAPHHVPRFPGHDDGKAFQEWRNADDKAKTDAKAECVQWLVSNGYPEWEHPARYW